MRLRRQQPVDEGQDWTLPAINWLVQIVVGEAEPASSRVEDREGTAVVVAVPRGEDGEPVAMAVGIELELHWTTERGLWTCPAKVSAVVGDPLPCWTLLPTEEPQFHQRRDAYRLPVAAIVLVEADGRATEAKMLDLSETGLRCRVEVELNLPDGTPLVVTLPLGEETLRARAEVARTVETDVYGTEYGLRLLDLDPADADRLRRHLINAQLRRSA